jgi:putative Ca2+/H+ antiporter (TMEM165/GDT1 family)
VALAARFDSLAQVVLGTTLGMMIANAPAVWLGEKLADHISMKAVRITAAVLFIGFGMLTLFGTSS